MTAKSSVSRKDDLVDAMLHIVATRGLEALSVREVARETTVSIGTVQHYFPTKDEMLAAAFAEVVARVRTRIARVALTSSMSTNISMALRELLPLDERRGAEIRIQLAFSARAAVSPALAAIQRATISGITDELASVFRAAGQAPSVARTSARLAIAATDGLALHAVSGADLTARQQTTALDQLLKTLLQQ